ncbi:hypothetical protein JCM3766R1_005429 [Sporobolomyces carnicolor]
MFTSITSAFGFTRPTAPPPPPTFTLQGEDDVVAEPATTSVQFPALGSQQRAKLPSVSIDNDDDDDNDNDRDEPEDDDEDETETETDKRASLAPPTTTTKLSKVPRVRVEKGFSQLDWAKLNRSGQVDLRGGVTELKRIRVQEMLRHNSREDCWQAYNGKVYNVTPFLKFHPGGVGEMMRGAGKDATQLFMLAHAWVNYETLLENCLVGFLVRD